MTIISSILINVVTPNVKVQNLFINLTNVR